MCYTIQYIETTTAEYLEPIRKSGNEQQNVFLNLINV